MTKSEFIGNLTPTLQGIKNIDVCCAEFIVEVIHKCHSCLVSCLTLFESVMRYSYHYF